MDRRRFIGRFGVVAGLLPGAKTWLGGQVLKRTLLYEGPVAGFQYYAGKQRLAEIQKGDGVILKPEPDNRYDQNALAIYWKGEKLGFVSREHNLVLSRLAQAAFPLVAEVSRVRVDKEAWEQVQVRIWLEG